MDVPEGEKACLTFKLKIMNRTRAAARCRAEGMGVIRYSPLAPVAAHIAKPRPPAERHVKCSPGFTVLMPELGDTGTVLALKHRRCGQAAPYEAQPPTLLPVRPGNGSLDARWLPL